LWIRNTDHLLGAFDIISEFFPHVAIILYRVFPERHRFLSRVFLLSCFTTATGTLCETIVTMWLFGSLWGRWRLAFKVVTPLLHAAFSAAQIHGSLVFWRMHRRQQRFLKEVEGDIEARDGVEMSKSLGNDEAERKDQHITEHSNPSLFTIDSGAPIVSVVSR
jgi:hypothetical protein